MPYKDPSKKVECQKRYRKKNKSKIQEYAKNNYQQKKDYYKKYYENNRSKKLAYLKEYREKNKDKLNKKDREYAQLNKDKIKKYHRLYHYNLTEEEYQSLLVTQNNKCAICEKEFSKDNKLTTPHVDHDHTSSKIRGLLCSRCNILLGFAEDDITLLNKASQYLTMFGRL